MRQQFLRRTLLAAAVGVLLAGCSSTVVVGRASPGEGEPVDVSAEAFPITGVSDTPIDQFARNALTDLNTFWGEAYPHFYDGKFQPLRGGYFSVDSDNIDKKAYPDTGIGCGGAPKSPDSVSGNAFYDPACDLIAYDRSLLEELSTGYGRFLVPVVMAHEFGHAMQKRFGYAASGRSIQDETQADCFAGAWSRWVADGKAAHTSLRTPELDGVVRGFLLLRDDVGSDPEGAQAHGSFFDRVSAFYEGFDGGVASCRDDFGTDRLFTAAPFSASDAADQGNAPYDDIVGWIRQTLPAFWNSAFSEAFGRNFRAPRFRPFDGTAPHCGDDDVSKQNLGYCPKNSTVYYDETDLTHPAYRELGDFAVATALALPYSTAVRGEGGLSVDDAAATRSAVCLTGWYTDRWYAGAFDDTLKVKLSPGDVDEAVQFLLRYGADPAVFPNTALSGFEMVGAFRSGFLEGGAACDIGL